LELWCRHKRVVPAEAVREEAALAVPLVGKSAAKLAGKPAVRLAAKLELRPEGESGRKWVTCSPVGLP
jgi:hypothetical protein